MEVACGSRDIRDIVSACTVWFTFVSRTPTPRAVEDFVIKDLHDSRGSCLRLLPCFPLCSFIIAHSWLFVKHFFEKSQFYFLGFRLHLLLSRSVLLAKSLVEELGNTPWNRTFVEMSFRTPFVPLLYHTLRDLSRGFLNFLFGREILIYFTQLRIGERLFAPVYLFCILIVSQLGRFVKSYIFPRRYLTRTSWQFFLSSGFETHRRTTLAELARGFL